FRTSAVDRSGTPGRTQLAIYRIGPRISAPLGTFADLGAAFRFQQVFYSGSDLSAQVRQPSDNSAAQVVFSVDTANRSSRLQLLTTGEFQRASRHFESANAVQTIYLRLTPKLRV